MLKIYVAMGVFFLPYLIGPIIFSGSGGFFLILDLIPLVLYPMLSFAIFPKGASYKYYRLKLWCFSLIVPWVLGMAIGLSLNLYYLYVPTGILSGDIYLGYLIFFHISVFYVYSLIFILIKTHEHSKTSSNKKIR